MTDYRSCDGICLFEAAESGLRQWSLDFDFDSRLSWASRFDSVVARPVRALLMRLEANGQCGVARHLELSLLECREIAERIDAEQWLQKSDVAAIGSLISDIREAKASVVVAPEAKPLATPPVSRETVSAKCKPLFADHITRKDVRVLASKVAEGDMRDKIEICREIVGDKKAKSLESAFNRYVRKGHIRFDPPLTR